MPTNYQNGKIYRIVCNITGLTYIGSTCQTLSQRLTKHRFNYKTLLEKPEKKLVTSVKVIAGGDYDIVLLEKCPCESKEELHKRERYYIESMDCVNKVIPTRTEAEKKKVYYDANKEAIAEKNKVIVECGCGSTHRHRDKARHFKSLGGDTVRKLGL